MIKGKKTNNTFFSIPQIKSLKNYIKYENNFDNQKNRFDFLYENSKIIRKKLETERLIKEFNERNRMIPEISNKSKLISRNKKFHERLYQNFKSTLEHEELIDEKSLLDNYKNKVKNTKYDKFYNINKTRNKQSQINFSFHPLLNKKSINIAESLPIKSKERLESLSKNEEMRKKEILDERKIKEENKNNKYNIIKSSQLIKENKRCSYLYLKAMESIKKKEDLYRKEEKKKKNLYKNYSFQPIINKNFSNKNIIKSKSFSDIYTRNKIWKTNVTNKTLKLKEYNKKKDQSNYTFSPRINESIMDIDSSFIQSNITEYISFINQYNEKEKKKLYEKKQAYINFNTRNPKKILIGFEDEKSMNLIMDKTKINKTKASSSINEIEKQRNILKTSNFFTDYNFNNNLSYNYVFDSQNSKDNFSKTRNQSFSFSDAVKKILNQIN